MLKLWKIGENDKKQNQEYTPRVNSEGKYIINTDDPRDVKWLNERRAKRGASYV